MKGRNSKMKKMNPQLLNTLVIIIGAVFLITGMYKSPENPYLKIIGLIILMFGLYRATTYWSETKDDYKKTDQKEENDL